MKRVTLLGATGSIGHNVFDVIASHPEEFTIVGMASRTGGAAFADRCAQYPDSKFVLTDGTAHAAFLGSNPSVAGRSVGTGEGALDDLVGETQPDLVVNALVGVVGLSPTITALEAGIPVALANKESVVTGGEILTRAARSGRSALLPIDSEHVAIAQCIGSEPMASVKRVIITASGGSLRDRPVEQFEGVTIEEVLAHPTWDMGNKITVDSATLMNKGLEVIEARWLFDLAYERIDVVIHPQSIIHSMVEFVDGSILAQMGQPDMRHPILYAMSHPRRVSSRMTSDITAFPELTFAEVDINRYPCFELARRAAMAGGSAPTVLNAANELAVTGFLNGNLSFVRIAEVVDGALQALPERPIGSLEEILDCDRVTREWIRKKYSLERVGSNRM